MSPPPDDSHLSSNATNAFPSRGEASEDSKKADGMSTSIISQRSNNLAAAKSSDGGIASARAYLMAQSSRTGFSVYEHMVDIVAHLLERKPMYASDAFESISAQIKRTRFSLNTHVAPLGFCKALDESVLQNVYVLLATQLYNTVQRQMPSPANDNTGFDQSAEGSGETGVVRKTLEKEAKKVASDPATAAAVTAAMVAKMSTLSEDDLSSDTQKGQAPDILDLMRLFEWAGCSIGREETYGLVLAIRRLVAKYKLKSVRFWGRINCTNGMHYYIIEAEETEGATLDAYNAEVEENSGANAAGGSGADPEGTAADAIALTTNAALVGGGASGSKAQPNSLLEDGRASGLPTPRRPARMLVPGELPTTGCNKYAYYVTSDIGSAWRRLPDVHPAQIVAARTIRKLFTGDLDHRIVSYPLFPGGIEKYYLRAQIARISAGAVVCPAGYYQRDTDAVDEENPEANANMVVNTENEMLPNEAMLSLDNWVHQLQYILPQGRTVYAKASAVASGSGSGRTRGSESHGGRQDGDADGDGDGRGGDADGSGESDEDGDGEGEGEGDGEENGDGDGRNDMTSSKRATAGDGYVVDSEDKDDLSEDGMAGQNIPQLLAPLSEDSNVSGEQEEGGAAGEGGSGDAGDEGENAADGDGAGRASENIDSNVPAWTVGVTSRLQARMHNVIHLRSNRWPGAHTVYYGGRFASLYVGNGLKERGGGQAHSLPPQPVPQREWTLGARMNYADLREQTDPTLAEETEYEESRREREENANGGGDGDDGSGRPRRRRGEDDDEEDEEGGQ